MAYTPREIKDRVAVGDDIFIIEDLGNNRIRLIPAPTYVSEPGTPVNKALLQPIEDELGALSSKVDTLTTSKVDKVPGKGLSTNDFTNALKNKLDGIEAGAQVNTVTSVAGKTGAVTLTKSDVGLGNVQNYGIATQAQAQAGTANDVYMTPLRVKEAIASLGIRLVTGTYVGNSSSSSRNLTVGVDFRLLIVVAPDRRGLAVVPRGASEAVNGFAVSADQNYLQASGNSLTIGTNSGVKWREPGVVELYNMSSGEGFNQTGITYYYYAFY